MLVASHIPVPYFRIDQDFFVVEQSEEARELFPDVDSFLALVDGGSKSKATEYISPKHPKMKLEVTMCTRKKPVSLFELHVVWEESGIGNVVCMVQDHKFVQLTMVMEQLRERLATTDFHLLEKKEELEQALMRVNELSGPFISLTDTVALVPIYGALTGEKIEAVNEHILQKAHQDSFEQILFDFTSVSEIRQEGVKELENLLKALWLMGQIDAVIIGVSPPLAMMINQHNWFTGIKYLPNLRQAIKQMVG